jgi:LacI family transcriptional regulator
VSLVLRESPLVAEKTRARVLESARKLDYVYHRGAASLRTQRTHTVGVAMNDLLNPYFCELVAAIEKALASLGRTVFLSNSNEDPASQARFIASMREYNADGLMICPAIGTAPEALRRVAEAGMPCVLISRDLPGSGIDYAGNDHRRGTRLATEHLIRLGHRRLAMVGGNEGHWTARERRGGFLDALTAHGLTADPALVVAGALTRDTGAAAIRLLMAPAAPPTGIVCFNDIIAFGVMLGLRQMAIEPGRDVAVVGCDDVAEAALWTPALTTVAIDFVAMGDAAARVLIARIADPTAPRQSLVLQPRLVVRASCGEPRTDRFAPRPLTRHRA